MARECLVPRGLDWLADRGGGARAGVLAQKQQRRRRGKHKKARRGRGGLERLVKKMAGWRVHKA